MNKIVKIISGVVLLLAIVGLGFFCWQKWQQKQEESLGYIQFEEFTKQEAGGEVYFENAESGLKFKVPSGWNTNPSQMASVALKSPDFVDFKEVDSIKSFIPKTGCWIGVIVKKTLSDAADYAIIQDRLSHQDLLSTINRNDLTYFIVNINGKDLLKTDYLVDSDEENIINFLSVEFPQKNKLYSFKTTLSGKDKEKCSQLFNEFLTTIFIK
jgi:hypothetical protein